MSTLVSTTEFPAKVSFETYLIAWAIQELLDPDNSLGDLSTLRTVIGENCSTALLGPLKQLCAALDLTMAGNL